MQSTLCMSLSSGKHLASLGSLNSGSTVVLDWGGVVVSVVHLLLRQCDQKCF